MSEALERFKNKSSTYLAPLENTEGKLDFEAHKVAEVLNNEMRESLGYIGVAPIGSMVRGYATKDSDIDVVVFRERALVASSTEEDAFIREICEHVVAKSKTKRTFSFIQSRFSEKDVQHVIEMAKQNSYDENPLWMYIFSPTAIGPKIEEYRTMVKEALEPLPEDVREKAVMGMAYALVRAEIRSHEKIEERIPGIDDEQQKNIFRERYNLWMRQIHAILDA